MPPDQSLQSTYDDGDLGWRVALVRLVVVWTLLILAFAPDWAAMARHWWGSSTYNHIILIPPIAAWLVSLRWQELRKLPPRIWPPGLVLFAGTVFVWVLGSFAGFSLVQQGGAVLALVASTITLLGLRVGIGAVFPLCYLLFLVPFGDELVPALQLVTAALTIALVKLSGIAATIDGVFIATPAGLFEVAEACSGVKFLIAMIAFGALVANVCFRSRQRRLTFMLLCVIAPVLANGVRAWGTIFAAQYVGVERAGGLDHIIYGWLFFAIVIAAVLAVSWRFFDRAADDAMIDAAAIAAARIPRWIERANMSAMAVIMLAGAILLVGHAWVQAASTLQAQMPKQIFLPDVPGWKRIAYAPAVAWQPRASGAAHRLLGRYADAQGHRVDVFLALYPDQADGREATGFGEGALPEDGDWSWNSAGPATPNAKSDLLRAGGRLERLAQTYYRNSHLLTGSALELKLATIANRLLLRREPTVMLILSTELAPNQDAANALDRFRTATGPVGPWMDRIVAVR